MVTRLKRPLKGRNRGAVGCCEPLPAPSTDARERIGTVPPLTGQGHGRPSSNLIHPVHPPECLALLDHCTEGLAALPPAARRRWRWNENCPDDDDSWLALRKLGVPSTRTTPPGSRRQHGRKAGTWRPRSGEASAFAHAGLRCNNTFNPDSDHVENRCRSPYPRRGARLPRSRSRPDEHWIDQVGSAGPRIFYIPSDRPHGGTASRNAEVIFTSAAIAPAAFWRLVGALRFRAGFI